MKRITILLIMLLFVVACGPAGGSEETAVSPLSTQAPEPIDAPVAEQEAPAVSEPEPTDEPEPIEESVEEIAISSVPANEMVAAFTPATTAEEAAVIREQDWQHGTDDPDIIIIEYSDFQ